MNCFTGGTPTLIALMRAILPAFLKHDAIGSACCPAMLLRALHILYCKTRSCQVFSRGFSGARAFFFPLCRSRRRVPLFPFDSPDQARDPVILKQRGPATSKPVLPSRPAYRREEKSSGLYVSHRKRKPAMAHRISLQGRLYSLTPQPSRWYDYAVRRDCEPDGRKRKGRA